MTARLLFLAAPLLCAVGVGVGVGVGVIVVSAAQAADANACTALPFQTLLLSCGGVCPTTNHSCVVYAAAERNPCNANLSGASPKSSCVAPAADASCVYQCFQPFQSVDVFRFYVWFNTSSATTATMAPPLTAASSGSRGSGTNDANDADEAYPPFETNEFVRRIGLLELPSFIRQLVFSGGRDEDNGARGDVVDLEIDPAAFSKMPNIQLVGLLNIDLGRRLPDLPAILPKSVPVVDLTNTNLSQVPTSLHLLTELDALSLLRNFIQQVPTSLDLPKLKTLYLGENSLTSFDTAFPSLEFLDLSDNKLTTFPSVVFSMPMLTQLKMDKNPDMATVIFSTDQYAQLDGLQLFSIDSGAMDNTSCTADQVKAFRNQEGSVCVVTAEQLAAYTGKQRNGGSDGGGGLSTTALVIIIVVAVLAVGGGSVGFVYKKKRRQRQQQANPDDTTGTPFTYTKVGDPSTGSAAPSGSTGTGPFKKSRHAAMLLSDTSMHSSDHSLWDDDDMLSRQLPLEDIEDLRVIGSGGFAIVWLVRHIPLNRLLASKRLIKDQVTRQKTLDFVMEIKLNMQLDHPNVVQLVGVAWTVETDLQALLEYLPNGDLRSFLESSQHAPMPWNQQKLQLAIDIVEALVYVHSFTPSLVHRDLKSRNVLLTENLTAKVCDFGVSRFVSDHGTMTTGVGTGKWLAPEVIAGSRSYDSSCDIYAFGVLLSELDTHRLPYDELTGPQGNKLPEVAVLQMVASGQVRPTLTAACPPAIQQVASECLSFDPSTRPTAMQVVYSLRSIRKEMLQSE